MTSAERRCEAHFNETTIRNPEGRFIVRLPFVEPPHLLGDSKGIAFQRFIALERRLAKSIELKNQYVEFMQEYRRLGHMEEINYKHINKPYYFLPYHCVPKSDSSTTKLRVVFDGSAKTTSNFSLNDIIATGPTVQDDVFSIHYGIMAPVIVIAKLFLQQLWELKYDWDAALPQEMQTTWLKYREDLKAFRDIMIPKHVRDFSSEQHILTIMDNQIIFKVRLPLIGLNEFTLFRNIPIPAIVNNSLTAIETSSTYLAINAHQDEYYPLSDADLSTCIIIKATRHLCIQNHPIYRRGSNISMCEISLLNNISSLSTCKLRDIGTNPVWNKIPNANQWIFAVTTDTLLNAVCDNKASIITISGTGLLLLQPTCVIRQNFLTLKAHQTYSSSVQLSHTHFIQDANFMNVTHLASLSSGAMNVEANIMDFQGLRDQINAQRIELPNQIHHQNIQHTIMRSCGIFLSVTIIAYLIWKHRSIICKKKPTAPIPSPRYHLDNSDDSTDHQHGAGC